MRRLKSAHLRPFLESRLGALVFGGPLPIILVLGLFPCITVFSLGLVGLIIVISLGFLPELIEVPPRFFAGRALPLGARQRSGLPLPITVPARSHICPIPRAGRGYQPLFPGPVKAPIIPVGS